MDNFLVNFIQTNTLEQQCCNSNQLNRHFLSEPVKLPCNNQICSKCYKQYLKNYNNFEDLNFKCSFCSQEHSRASCTKTDDARKLTGVADGVLKQFKDKLKSYEAEIKEKLSSAEDLIETYVEFLRDEVLIHAEKIKNEIEQAYETFIKQLESFKNEIKVELNDLKSSFNSHSSPQKPVPPTELDNLSKCESYLNELRAYDTQFYSILNSIDFKPINHVSFSFGKLKRNSSQLRIHDWKKTQTIKAVKLSPVILIEGMCALKNEKLLLSDSYSGFIFVLDEKFQIVHRLTEIEKFKFKHPCELAYDGVDTIYVNDQGNRTIALVDKNLKTLKSAISNVDACDIAVHDGFLYVCGEERVRSPENTTRESYLKKYTRNGTLISKLFGIQVDALHPFPLKLKVNSSLVACMVTLDGVSNFINIYDLSGHLKYELNFVGMENFCLTDQSLFVLNTNLDVQVFNIKGGYQVAFNNSFNAEQLIWKGGLLHTSMVLFNGKFVISSDFNGLLIFG